MLRFQAPTPKRDWDMEWQLIGWRIRIEEEEDQQNQYPPVGNGEANMIILVDPTLDYLEPLTHSLDGEVNQNRTPLFSKHEFMPYLS